MNELQIQDNSATVDRSLGNRLDTRLEEEADETVQKVLIPRTTFLGLTHTNHSELYTALEASAEHALDEDDSAHYSVDDHDLPPFLLAALFDTGLPHSLVHSCHPSTAQTYRCRASIEQCLGGSDHLRVDLVSRYRMQLVGIQTSGLGPSIASRCARAQ